MENSANDLLLNGKSQNEIAIAINTEANNKDEDYIRRHKDKKVFILLKYFLVLL